MTLARHYTTNALDSDLAFEDWYTALRGSLEKSVGHELGTTKLSADFELRRYDTYDIEDDRAVGITAETTIRPSATTELRGTLSLRTISNGDDFPIEGFILGTRTRKTILGGALQAGLLVAPDTVLLLESAASREFAGRTRFQLGAIEPTRLEPDRDLVRIGATLTRTQVPYSYGASAVAGLRLSHAVEPLPEILLSEYAAKLQAAASFSSEATISGAVGLQMLHLLNGTFTDIRPTVELAAAMPLGEKFSLRGSFRAAYDTTSTDDPLAVWVRRAEAELGYRASATITVALGAFDERRDNVVIGNQETVRGLYALTGWQANDSTALILRVDARRRLISLFDIEKRTIDAQIAVTRSL